MDWDAEEVNVAVPVRAPLPMAPPVHDSERVTAPATTEDSCNVSALAGVAVVVEGKPDTTVICWIGSGFLTVNTVG